MSMTPVRIEKSFTRVLNALAELEALSSNEASPGVSAATGRLELRLEHYLDQTDRLASERPELDADLIRALLGRLKEAVVHEPAAAIISATSDLRDQVAAHFRALGSSEPSASV